MLTDRDIDKLIQPLVDNAEQLNLVVLKLLAKQIALIGKADSNKLKKLALTPLSQHDIKYINVYRDRLIKVQKQLLYKVLTRVAFDEYSSAEEIYEYSNVEYPKFNKNKQLQDAFEKVFTKTLDDLMLVMFANIMLLRDMSNPSFLTVFKLEDAFLSIYSEALQNAQAAKLNTLDYNTLMYRTTKQIVDSGLRAVTINGNQKQTFKVDNYMRTVVLNGVRDIQQATQDVIASQAHTDGKEISVHIDSAPDHEPVQGHQFTNEEFDRLQSDQPFKDIYGNSFAPIRRAIGTWNCRHYTYAIIVGVTPPKYTVSGLAETMRINHMGITLSNGRHLTRYECTQYQRQLERKIRGYKELQIFAKESGNLKLAKTCQTKVNNLNTEYVEFSTESELDPLFERTKVIGYAPNIK